MRIATAGGLTQALLLGFDHVDWSKIWRIAGVDHMHVNGLQSKFSDPEASVIASARSLQTPLWPDAPSTLMPVFSIGQSVAQVHGTWAALGSGWRSPRARTRPMWRR